MQITKVFGLAVVAAVAAMAFIGAGTASAQEHKIVLCKELVTLCPTGKLWPTLTRILALASGPQLHNSLGTISCEDSIVEGELAEEIGSPLNIKNATAVFGVLPTPKLGLGCTGACTSAGSENVHASLENLQIEVSGVNEYFLKGSGLALILNCPLVGTCAYRGENILFPIKHDGSHPLHSGNNLPLVKFEVTLTRQTTHSGSSFCPATSNWLATYVIHLVHATGFTSGLAWPALDK